ncbi:MAG: SseB family protein [Lachnospiraceae bacterium]|nr:SseB family protein [Lachnospiraceae bacterium]
MSDENKVLVTEEEAALTKRLVEAETLYFVLSLRTKLPLVVCDQETFDDEVLVYENVEELQKLMNDYQEEYKQVDIAVVARKDRLNFFANLCTMGVNCILVNAKTGKEERIQLDRIVRTPKGTTPDGQPWIENTALHLTAIYFMQEVAKNVTGEETPVLTEMREEIVAHYSQGNYIIIFNEKGQLPIIKFPSGDSYQPIFTDMFEASKFRSDQPVKMGAVFPAKIPGLLAQEAKGIVINPGGVCLQLPIIRQNPQQPTNPQPADAN